ncbi:hypothetical protein ACTFIV_000507 [Dictyostelium citrinum]
MSDNNNTLPNNFTVGYYLSNSKINRLKWNLFVDMCKEKYNINVVPIDMNKDINTIDTRPYHVIIDKLTDELGDLDNPSNKQKVDYIESLINKFPSIVEVDPLESQKPVLSRDTLTKLLDKLNDVSPELNIKNPKFVLVPEDYNNNDYNQLLKDANIKFPLVCKTIKACGSEESHYMGIVFNEKDIHQFKQPMLIQEFINHNAIIYKVFAIGDYIHVVHRKSIRNMNENENELIKFDSQKPFPASLLPTDGQELKIEIPSKSTLSVISKDIQKNLDISLFGFDVIVDCKTKKLAVVDINYFPTFSGVDDFYTLLIEHIINVYKRKSSV